MCCQQNLVQCRNRNLAVKDNHISDKMNPKAKEDSQSSKQHVFETAAPTDNAPDPDMSPCVCLCTTLWWVPVQTLLTAAAVWFVVLLQLRDLSAQV